MNLGSEETRCDDVEAQERNHGSRDEYRRREQWQSRGIKTIQIFSASPLNEGLFLLLGFFFVFLDWNGCGWR
jgi:hypothetical protein